MMGEGDGEGDGGGDGDTGFKCIYRLAFLYIVSAMTLSLLEIDMLSDGSLVHRELD